MNILHHIEKRVDALFAFIPRPSPSKEIQKSAHIVAHRGAHDDALGIQENTHEAFQRAVDLGCYGIEFDLHATRDDVLVVNHDSDVQRLWKQQARIRELCFAELKNLVPKLPSFAEIIERYAGKTHLFIELKAPFHAPHTLTEQLKSLTPCKDYHLISLDESVFHNISAIPKEAMLLIPVHNNTKKMCDLSLDKKYGGILGHYFLLKNHQVHTLQQAKQLVGVGFVESRYSLYRELSRGISLLFTNQAKAIASFINEDQPSPRA